MCSVMVHQGHMGVPMDVIRVYGLIYWANSLQIKFWNRVDGLRMQSIGSWMLLHILFYSQGGGPSTDLFVVDRTILKIFSLIYWCMCLFSIIIFFSGEHHNNHGVYSQQTTSMLEDENSDMTNNLADKVKALKSVSIMAAKTTLINIINCHGQKLTNCSKNLSRAYLLKH